MAYDLAVIYNINDVCRSSMLVYIYVLETYRVAYVNKDEPIDKVKIEQTSFANRIKTGNSLVGLGEEELGKKLGQIIFGEFADKLNVFYVGQDIRYDMLPLGVNDEGLMVYYNPNGYEKFTCEAVEENYVLDKELKDFSEKLNLKLGLSGNNEKTVVFNNKIYGSSRSVPNKYKTYISGKSCSVEAEDLDKIKVMKKASLEGIRCKDMGLLVCSEMKIDGCELGMGYVLDFDALKLYNSSIDIKEVLNVVIGRVKKSKIVIDYLISTLTIEVETSDSEIRINNNTEEASVYFAGNVLKSKIYQEKDTEMRVIIEHAVESDIYLRNINNFEISGYMAHSNIYLEKVETLDVFQAELADCNVYVEDCKFAGQIVFDFECKECNFYFKNESCKNIVQILIDRNSNISTGITIYVSEELKEALYADGYTNTDNEYTVVNWEELNEKARNRFK